MVSANSVTRLPVLDALVKGPGAAAPACPTCGQTMDPYAEEGSNEYKRGTAFCHGCGVRHRLVAQQTTAAAQATPGHVSALKGTLVASEGQSCRYCGHSIVHQHAWGVTKDGRRYPVGHPMWYCTRVECRAQRQRAGNKKRQQARRDRLAKQREQRAEEKRRAQFDRRSVG
jgi:DNA-directed RNA polymerase subunit RPC12/RpoP